MSTDPSIRPSNDAEAWGEVLIVYGTRPEAIKLAPLISGIDRSSTLSSCVAVTGQHRQMLDQVNKMFGITVDYDLELLRHGQTLTEIASRAMSGLQPVIEAERPAALVVQGDTTTALAGALAAHYSAAKVVHLEAGLRSGNKWSPWPEEMNRRMIGQLADLHLAPTERCRRELLREGIDDDTIVVSGNTVIDSLQTVIEESGTQVDWARPGERMILVTAHRRESWGPRMRNALLGVADVAAAYPDVRVIFPVHRNPVVRDAAKQALSGLPNVNLIDPLDYGDFANLLKQAHIILTDSGGIQEEAPSLGVPVLVLRENTERPEAVEAGAVRLVGTDRDRVREETMRLLDSQDAYDEMARAINPYGDGKAGARSVAAIEALLGMGSRIPDFSS